MTSSLRIIFAGTPVFAAVALRVLIQSSHEIVAVLTQPDRPAGRGLQMIASPVKELALQYELTVSQPFSLKDPIEQAHLVDLQPDIMIVAAYGMLLPSAVLSIPRLGCVNIHPSLLPRWRGAAPIQRAIFAGDQITGVTIMQMDAGLDTGPILLQRSYIMGRDETTQTLHDKLAKLGADSLLESLHLLAIDKAYSQLQDNQLATYAHKITKEEAQLDWTQTAIELECKIRAFNPKPVAYTNWRGERLRIWMARAMSAGTSEMVPGTLLQASSEGIDIATGDGVIQLLELQLPGSKKLNVADFYHARYADLIPGQPF